jgi:hypothetical protein
MGNPFLGKTEIARKIAEEQGLEIIEFMIADHETIEGYLKRETIEGYLKLKEDKDG